MDIISCAFAEVWLLSSSVGFEELGSVGGVGLSGGVEDVFGVFFHLKSTVSVVAHVSLWLDVIDLALSVDDNWLTVNVLDVTVVVVLLGVLVVAVGMSVVLETLESLQLVPESSVLNGLDLGGLSDSWLIGDGELLLLKLNVLNWLMFIRVLLLNVASIVRSIPGLDSSEQEGGGKSSHSVYL